MKTIPAAALAMLVCSSAAAQTVSPAGPRALPPPQFDKPFTGTLTVMYADTGVAVGEFCKKEGRLLLGCAQRYQHGRDIVCNVMLAPDYVIKRYGYEPKDVLRHEIGHCNGWPRDHSDPAVPPAGWPVVYPDPRGTH